VAWAGDDWLGPDARRLECVSSISVSVIRYFRIWFEWLMPRAFVTLSERFIPPLLSTATSRITVCISEALSSWPHIPKLVVIS
jgi:hypothetical protein